MPKNPISVAGGKASRRKLDPATATAMQRRSVESRLRNKAKRDG